MARQPDANHGAALLERLGHERRPIICQPDRQEVGSGAVPPRMADRNDPDRREVGR
jgi:hypothetical protein